MKSSKEIKGDTILIHTAKTIELVSLKEVIRLEADQNYAKIYLQDGRDLVSTKNLGYYRDLLKKHSFFQCHKSHFINENKILRYYKEGIVEMKDDSQVPVSRRMREPFLVRLKELFDKDGEEERVKCSNEAIAMAL